MKQFLNLWELYRVLGAVSEMYSASGPCVIDASGTDWWWERAGLLENRNTLLSDATSALRERAYSTDNSVHEVLPQYRDFSCQSVDRYLP